MVKVFWVILLLSACSVHHSIQITDSGSVVHYHRGGHIASVMQEIAAHPKPYRVKGLCASSCTYVLSFDDTCVDPDATFVFHQASANRPDVQKAWTRIMFNWYPDKLRDHMHRYSRPNQNYVIDGDQLNKLFGVKLCADTQ